MATKKDPDKAMQIRGFFTCEQAAAKLGMKPDTVRRYVHRGLIEAGLIGDVYLISQQELSRFSRERRERGRPVNCGKKDDS